MFDTTRAVDRKCEEIARELDKRWDELTRGLDQETVEGFTRRIARGLVEDVRLTPELAQRVANYICSVSISDAY